MTKDTAATESTNQSVFDNVDSAEISKFSELAARWWDTESEFRPLHQINPLRLDYIKQQSPIKGKRILDVGCGGGILSEAMALDGAEVTGIDMGEAPLNVARLHALETSESESRAPEGGLKLEYLQITAEQLATRHAGEFDIVTCLEMLEHVPDPASVITACANLVKPGGKVYFSTLNRNPKSFLFAIVGAEYVLNLLPRGTHQYEKFIKPSELNRWSEQAGLRIEGVIGMHYNPLLKSYSLAPGPDVNYIVHASRPLLL